MSTFNADAVERFIKMVAQSLSYNSKEVRLTVHDAQSLADSLSLLLLQERNLTQQILILQDKLLKQAGNTPTLNDVSLTGGKF